MHNANQDQIIEAIRSELPLLYGCIRKAWETYQKSYPEALKQHHTARSRASLVHDHAVAYAREIFEARVGTSCQEINKLFLICFANGIVIRFKKLDEKLRASNVATQQCMDFMTQVPLPFVDDAVNLHVGYRLNRLQTDIEGVYITRPAGPRSNTWFLPLEFGTVDNAHLAERDERPTPDTERKVKFSPRRKDQGNEAAK